MEERAQEIQTKESKTETAQDTEKDSLNKELEELRSFKAKIEEEQGIQSKAEELLAKERKEAVNVSDSFFAKTEKVSEQPKSNADKY